MWLFIYQSLAIRSSPVSNQASPEENLRCILFMVIAMAGFAVEDAVIKKLSLTMPVSQVLLLIGLGGLLVFGLVSRVKKIDLFVPETRGLTFLVRVGAELISAILFAVAIVYASLSMSSAILQATPLTVALGGALFLKQKVGMRQWALIGSGFIGVLLVLQPGLDGFKVAGLFAVLGVGFLALRDVVTRTMAISISPVLISFWGFFGMLLAGAVTIPIFGDFRVLVFDDLPLLLISSVSGSLGYYCVVQATQTGDVAVVAPFRYTRLLFALGLAVIFFDEDVNPMMVLGSSLIIGSGIVMIVSSGSRRKQIN